MTPSRLTEPATELATSILENTRDEIRKADNKAALLLASSGVIIGVLVAAILSGQWSPSDLHPNVRWLWWLGSLAAGVGTVSLASSVFPRTSNRLHRSATTIAYFGDVVKFARTDLLKNLEETAAGEQVALIDQLARTSQIAKRKYRGIQVGLWSFGAFSVAWIIAAIASI